MAQALAEAGAKAIALLDVKQHLGDQAAAELHQTTNIPAQFYKVDVRDENAIAKGIEKVAKDLGSLDIVINSAGVVDSNIKAETYDPAKFRNLMEINVTGSFLVSQAAARHMISGGLSGSIIFLSSIAGSRVLHPQQQCAYNASKAAVAQLARSLAAEWAPHGIRVNTIAPGYMDTALNREAMLEGQKKHWSTMTPMGRLGVPHELNGLAVFLASDAAGFVTGAEVLCDVSSRFCVSGVRGANGAFREVTLVIKECRRKRTLEKSKVPVSCPFQCFLFCTIRAQGFFCACCSPKRCKQTDMLYLL